MFARWRHLSTVMLLIRLDLGKLSAVVWAHWKRFRRCKVNLQLSWACAVIRVLPLLDLSRVVPVASPEGRPGMSDVSPPSRISGLSFDSTLLSSLFFLLLLLSSPFTLSVLSSFFLATGPFAGTLSKIFFSIFRWDSFVVCMAPV